jgi:hypothetical protein
MAGNGGAVAVGDMIGTGETERDAVGADLGIGTGALVDVEVVGGDSASITSSTSMRSLVRGFFPLDFFLSFVYALVSTFNRDDNLILTFSSVDFFFFLVFLTTTSNA